MSRLLADENFPLPVVEELRRLGHDVVTVQEQGKGNQRFPDLEVLKLASSEKRAVITLNRKHFVGLHQAFPKHSGIIVCSVDLDYVGQAYRVDEAINQLPSLKEMLLRINRSV